MAKPTRRAREEPISVPKAEADEVFDFFFDLLAFVARRGKALPNGDTVGRDEGERLKVRYEQSPINPKEKVWRVDLPG